jgi:hypothetical protein
MRRTELIPQTDAAVNAGTVYYHFSMMRSDTNAPSEFREHQIAFFESHFTEMKSGWQSGASGTSDPLLRWNAASTTQWNTTWEARVWHNVAYEINFDAGTVAFYHSTGADDLALAHEAVTVSASSDGKDWHLGVLELPRDGYTDATEDIYFSGVYVESGDLTTSVAGPGGVAAVASSSVSSSTPFSTSAAAAVSSSSSVEVVLSTATVIPVAVATSASTSVASSAAAVATSVEASLAAPAVRTSAVSSVSPASTSTPINNGQSTTIATVIRSSSIASVATPTSAGETPTEAGTADDDDEDDDCDYYY